MTNKLKQDLASAYKILAHLGLDDHTYTHLSVRSQDKNSFYIYPFGLRFEEVMADNLMKISLDGEVLVGEEYQYNRTGYVIHCNIYKARPDINAIFHLHTPATVAVSSIKDGLLPINQWALHFYKRIAYHDYSSLALVKEQGQTLANDLGEHLVMLLRGHGSIACGKTIQEALFYTYHLELACKAQCMTLAMNREVIMPSPDICQKAVNDLLSFEANLGERDWLAWLRLLERK
ncbi:MAG: class II aldolase/adducin family protein [Alphaproteobacteria bacterium]|jgi:ribulose-5-phosphate 4-epimerase/fuculose-1-phosphate aldolase